MKKVLAITFIAVLSLSVMFGCRNNTNTPNPAQNNNITNPAGIEENTNNPAGIEENAINNNIQVPAENQIQTPNTNNTITE